MRILIVEDDEDSRVYMEQALAAQGYEIASAGNGVQALEYCNTAPPGLIISDIMMPEMDGFELCRQIKKDESLRAIPFIFYTATYIDSRDIEFGISMGALRYLIKPMDILEFLAAIQDVLQEIETYSFTEENIPKNLAETDVAYAEVLTRKLTKKVRELEQERKALRAEIQKNALILASAGEGIFGLDKDGEITFINPAAISMSEYSELELTTLYGHSFWHHKHPNNTEYQELECPVCITLQAGHAWSGESYFIRKNGSSLPIHCICQPVVEEGMETSLVVSFMDITEKKLLVNNLINAKEKAEESNRLKSAFLANMSHEIRTPMNGIMGFVDLLQTPELSDEQKNLFTTILTKSCDRLLDTINDIIEISKIESQQPTVHYSEVDINELMDYLLEFFMPEAESKRLTFSMSAELQGEAAKINTDKNKLESILINLVKNALKFTSQGFIRFGHQLHDDTLIFSVKDSGIGIPKDRQKAIFNQFEQADLTFTKPHEGSGLGLAIAKAYAEMLGGKIQVESEIGKGSTFYFSVNYSPVQQKAKEAIDETVLQDNKLTESLILIAEDDINSFFYFQTILSKEKFELLHALNGEDAIKLCKNNPGISLILMDIKMPQMDGYEATRKIREFNKDVSIIAQTAFALHGDREKALEAGCDDYIVKPIKKDELKNIISKHLINV